MTMDPRLYMLAGTFALLVIALITSLVSVVKAVRRRRIRPSGPLAPPAAMSALPPAQRVEFDTSLESLESKAREDGLSAELLVPLRSEPWIPPEQPAPAETLPEASLEMRIASYPVAERQLTVPAVRTSEEPSATSSVPEPPAEAPATPDLGRIPAALSSVPEVVSESQYDVVVLPETVAEAVVDAEPVPLGPPGEPLEVEPSPFSDRPVAPEPQPLQIWLPPHVSEVQVQPEQSMAEPGATDQLWQPQPREQQDLPTIAPADDAFGPALTLASPGEAQPWEIPVVLAPAIERPATVIHEPPPEPVVQPSEPAAPRLPRPRAVVRAAAPEREEIPSAARISPLAAQTVAAHPDVRDFAPDLVMAAPVEMWFGDHRIGVKHGSKTYDQFRRYADVLFDDLRAAGKV